MAINWAFRPCQILWDIVLLNLAITMGQCDCLNVLFSKWCGLLRLDNGFTLHHSLPEALHVTRPLLFAAFCTNRTQHPHTFSTLDRCPLSQFPVTLKWIKKTSCMLVIWDLTVVTPHTYRYNPVSGRTLKLSFISAQKRLCLVKCDCNYLRVLDLFSYFISDSWF